MTRKKIFQLIFGVIAVTFIICGGLLLIGNFTIDKLPFKKTDTQLRIVSMNVSADNVLKTSFQDNLLLTQPDIIVIIEWTGNNIDLTKFAKAGYKTILNQPRKKVHGICILSKLDGISTIIEAPIKTPCTLPLGQFRFNWKEKNITLFAVHAPPPVPACKGTTSDYLKAISDWIENGKLTTDIGVGKPGDNLILAGDFNSLSFDNGIEKLRSKKLKNSFSKYNFVTPTWKPFVIFPYIAKIDYIFFSENIKSTANFRFRIDNSDHLGLVTDLSF